MMTIVEQGGFQFKVSEGDTINVPLIDAETGSEITIDRVRLVDDGTTVKIGTPVVDGVVVKAEVVDHGKDDKVLVIKKHRRKDYHRKNGHRQNFTNIRITSITV